MRDNYSPMPSEAVETRATLMSALEQLEGMISMAESTLHGNPPQSVGTVSGATPMPSNLLQVARLRVCDVTERLAKLNEELRALA
jgi:hypothetical protein